MGEQHGWVDLLHQLYCSYNLKAVQRPSRADGEHETSGDEEGAQRRMPLDKHLLGRCLRIHVPINTTAHGAQTQGFLGGIHRRLD